MMSLLVEYWLFSRNVYGVYVGIKNIETKKFTDLNEYFFAEDQGRYLIEIEVDNLKKVESILKKSNIFYEVVAEVQNDIFELSKTFSIKTEELYKNNNQWFKNLMPLTKDEISKMIMSAFPDASLELKDTMGDNNHYSAKIISKNFNGKSRVEQHKMVYKALKGKMGNELHALALTTEEQNE